MACLQSLHVLDRLGRHEDLETHSGYIIARISLSVKFADARIEGYAYPNVGCKASRGEASPPLVEIAREPYGNTSLSADRVRRARRVRLSLYDHG